MNELGSSIAHEINQPLAAIMANAEAARDLLDRDPPDLAEVRAALEDIVAVFARLGFEVMNGPEIELDTVNGSISITEVSAAK